MGPEVGELEYAIAVRKEDKELLTEVNKALVALRDSGKLREIYDRWNLWTPKMAAEFNDYSPSKVEPSRCNEWAEAHRPQLTFAKRLERYADALPAFGRRGRHDANSL